MSFNLSTIAKFVLGLPAKLVHFSNNPKVQAEFETIAANVNDLLKFALPAAQLVAAKSGNRTAAEVAAVLKEVGVLATIDPSTPANDASLKGLLLQATSAALKGQLKAAINDAGKAGLTVGKAVLTDVNTISPSLLDAASQLAYTFLSNSGALKL